MGELVLSFSQYVNESIKTEIEKIESFGSAIKDRFNFLDYTLLLIKNDDDTYEIALTKGDREFTTKSSQEKIPASETGLGKVDVFRTLMQKISNWLQISPTIAVGTMNLARAKKYRNLLATAFTVSDISKKSDENFSEYWEFTVSEKDDSISEALWYSEQPMLFHEYKEKFEDFEFENDVVFMIKRLEEKWIELREKYKWDFKKDSRRAADHFSFDIKVHLYPDEEEVKKRLNIAELSDSDITDMWFNYLKNESDNLVDSIDYSWVRHVRVVGKSGGWLLIYPIVTHDETIESIGQECDDYLGNKQTLEEQGKLETLKNQYADAEFAELVEAGVLNDVPEVASLKVQLKTLTDFLTDSMSDLNQVEEDLKELTRKIQNFKTNGLTWFYEYLQEEPNDALSALY